MTKDKKLEELQELSKPLQEWLFKNYHPHAKIIIDSVSSELVEGLLGTENKEIMNRD